VAFQPGQSGNPGGRSREKIWRNAITRAVTRVVDGKEGMQVVDELADALVQAARDKDVSALREIGDRLDGKAVQALANDPDNPLIPSEIRMVPVDVSQ
jgi:hypothetical protein